MCKQSSSTLNNNNSYDATLFQIFNNRFKLCCRKWIGEDDVERNIIAESSNSDNDKNKNNNDYQDLFDWLKSRGGWIHDGIIVSASSVIAATTTNPPEDQEKEGTRGIFATCDIGKDETLLSVPLDACLRTVDSLLSNSSTSDDNAAAPSWSKSLPNKVQLAITVLLKGGLHCLGVGEDPSSSMSSWEPYLKSWPKDIPELPDNIDPEILQHESQCNAFVEATKRYRSWVMDQYKYVIQMSPPGTSPFRDESKFPLKTFTTALQLVGSRSISLSSLPSSSSKPSVLVPVLDMANHNCDPNGSYKLTVTESKEDKDKNDSIGGISSCTKTTCIQLETNRAVSAGEEITISYGKHCNRQMAGCYGFVPNPNPYDYELVSLVEILQAAKDDGVLKTISAEQIYEINDSIQSMGFATTNFRIFSNGAGDDDDDDDLWLILGLTILFLKTPENEDPLEPLYELLEAIEMDEAEIYDLFCYDDIVRREEIMRSAYKVFERKLGGQQTSIEEDDRILQQNNLSPGMRLLVDLRRQRKLLFRNAYRSISMATDE